MLCWQGVIRQDGTGFATFQVMYKALVFRPYKGEVLDTSVTSVNKVFLRIVALLSKLLKKIRCVNVKCTEEMQAHACARACTHTCTHSLTYTHVHAHTHTYARMHVQASSRQYTTLALVFHGHSMLMLFQT
eukprot:68191-Pelagomonas_calceolata.AAC.2